MSEKQACPLYHLYCVYTDKARENTSVLFGYNHRRTWMLCLCQGTHQFIQLSSRPRDDLCRDFIVY